MMKLLKTKASVAALGVSLLCALFTSPAAHAAESGRCGYQGPHDLLKQFDVNPQVLHAQCLLKHYHGHSSIHTDGNFGKKTKAAVIAFQKRKGLKQDGKVGGKTWGKLHP